MDKILENEFIEFLTGRFKRSPWQKNGLQESDCELINLPGSNFIIALTTDSIVEEIERGLYSDPYMMGWMTVVVNLSDLSAAGAEPVGLLLNETLSRDLDAEFLHKLQGGIREACAEHGTYVLGGDTNFSSRMQMSGCAIGIIKDNSIITRLGCKPGDYLFSTGKLGLGNSYAFLKMTGKDGDSLNPILYKPKARIKEGQLLRKYASSCIDTSDGLIAATDQLMRLNNVGFVFESEIDQFIHPETLKISMDTGIPSWMFLAGIHGEFELVFTVPFEKVVPFAAAAQKAGWEPVLLGKAVNGKELRIQIDNNCITVDTTLIRNLFDKTKGQIQEYIGELFKIDQQWKSHTMLQRIRKPI